MPSCIIKGCKNRPTSNTTPGLSPSFHRFPVNKKELMLLWLESIGLSNLKDKVKMINIKHIICSDHFEKKYLNTVRQRTRLLPNAVPTIFNVDSKPNISKSGQWVLTDDSDDIEAILVEEQPHQIKCAEFASESHMPAFTAGENDNVPCKSKVFHEYGGNHHATCIEPVVEPVVLPAVTFTPQQDMKKEIEVLKQDDNEVSLSCFSPDSLSQQVVFPVISEPSKSMPTVSRKKNSPPLNSVLNTKLRIPSTCLIENQIDGVLENEEESGEKVTHEKLIILRAKHQNNVNRKNKLRVPKKIPAEAINSGRNKNRHVIFTDSDKKNRALALQKTEWHKPRDDVIYIADMNGMESNEDVSTKVHQLCRICAIKSNDTISIFGEQGKENLLLEKIHRYLPIQVHEEDRLPLQICRSCFTRLEDIDQLAVCSQDTEMKLRILLDAEDMQIEVEEMLVPKTVSSTMNEAAVLRDETLQQEKYVCNECQKEYKDFRRYARHCYAVHKKKKCKGCDKFFHTKDELIQHKTHEHGIQCECCGAKFININAQLSHLRREHPDHKACTCELCGKSFNSKYGLAIHYECHQEDRPFLCDTCGKSFKSKRKLKVHKCISNLNEALPANNACPNCGKMYTLRSSLKRHLLRHTGERRYQCEICNKSFYGSVYLRNHMVIHEKNTLYECQMCCARYFHKRNMISHLKDKHSAPWNYKCPSCDQIFPSIDDVVMHRKIHDIENIALGIPQGTDISQGASLDYHCKICGKNFENIYTLTYHFEEHVIRSQEELNIKTSGTDSGLFECTYCGETMTSIWTMKRHVRKAHHETTVTELIQYECGYCSKRFNTKSQMRQHVWQHTGEKPYKCQYCDAGFRTHTGLKVHVRTHTGETPYHCQKCPKQFRSAGALREHYNTHDKPFVCIHCGQRFPKKAAYKKHLILHSSEAPFQAKRSVVEYKCKHCDYMSKTRGAIRKHELSHEETNYFNL